MAQGKTRTGRTASVALGPYEVLPAQQEINDLINQYGEVASAEKKRQLREDIDEELRTLDDETKERPHHDWLMATMAHCVEGSVGNLGLALEHGITSLGLAQTDSDPTSKMPEYQRSTSCWNIGETLRELNEADLAYKFAEAAVDLCPQSVGAQVELLLSAIVSGRMDVARDILKTALEALADRQSAWQPLLNRYREVLVRGAGQELLVQNVLAAIERNRR